MGDKSGVEAIAMLSLRNKMGDIEVNPENIMTILKFTMEVAEVTELKGEAQKILCIKLLKNLSWSNFRFKCWFHESKR